MRALLGTGDRLRYINALYQDGTPNWSAGSTNIEIRHKEDEIKRFPSPILFKTAGSSTFFLPDESLSKEIMGKTFQFKEGKTLPTPTEKEFNLGEFLAAFADHINSDAMQTWLGKPHPPMRFNGKKISCINKGSQKGDGPNA
ncbi:MAG: hypothetical protein LBU47_03150 [Christensenellaceae bacterium]|nr:hypothetical protein [Christensenellaceae bacterium]